MTELFSEDNWNAITLMEQEGKSRTSRPKKWGAFPKSPIPDKVFFYPDIHFPFHDKLFLLYLDAQCDEFKPTHIVIIGDLLDCYSMSSFDKDPGRRETLNDERDMARGWLLMLRERHPDAIISFIEGNHEERIQRSIKRYLPGLYDMPELTTTGLLSLDRFNIRRYPSFGFKGWGYRIKHGKSTAKWSSNAEMLKHRMSGISGHVHRKQEAEFTDGEGLTTIWRSIGHSCNMDFVDYVESPNWVHCGGQLTAWPDGRREWDYLEG